MVVQEALVALEAVDQTLRVVQSVHAKDNLGKTPFSPLKTATASPVAATGRADR